jgi:hypothetical protein
MIAFEGLSAVASQNAERNMRTVQNRYCEGISKRDWKCPGNRPKLQGGVRIKDGLFVR